MAARQTSTSATVAASGRMPFCAHAGSAACVGGAGRGPGRRAARPGARAGRGRRPSAGPRPGVPGSPGIHGSGPAPALRSPEASRRQSRTAARSSCALQLPVAGGGPERFDGVLAGGAEQQQMGAQGGPGGLVRQPGSQCLDGGVQRVDHVDRGAVDAGRGLVAQQVLGGDVEAVEVALGGLAEPGGGVGLLAQQAGRGPLGVVAGQHRLEDVGGGERPDQGRVDHRVRVAVADDLEVDVVGVRAAGHHRVELLARLVCRWPGRAWCRR